MGRRGVFDATVAENAAVGTLVGVTASASDADATTNSVSYSLVLDANGGAYTAGEFVVDASSGVLSVAGPIDREAGATRTVFVRATSAIPSPNPARVSFSLSN
jgi:hypothetical protein